MNDQLGETPTGFYKDYDTRWSKEVDFQPKLEELSGKSFLDRFKIVREHFFGERTAIDGYRHTQISFYPSKEFKYLVTYPSPEVAQEGLNLMAQTVDKLYQQLKKSPNKNQAIRLTAIILSLGIIIHSEKDGNGQTFRNVAQSYLRELSPEKVHFFPIKESQNDPINYIATTHPFFEDFFQIVEEMSPKPVEQFKQKMQEEESPFPSGELTKEEMAQKFWGQLWSAALSHLFRDMPESQQSALDFYQHYLQTGKIRSYQISDNRLLKAQYLFRKKAFKMFQTREKSIKKYIGLQKEDFPTTATRIKKKTPFVTDIQKVNQS